VNRQAGAISNRTAHASTSGTRPRTVPGDIPDPEPIQLVSATSCTTLKAAVTPNGVDVVLMPGEQTCGSEADGAAERPNFTSAASETTLNIAVTHSSASITRFPAANRRVLLTLARSLAT
jgi:hypothetical protein